MSKVQGSSNAFNATYTAIISLIPTITPNNLSIYTVYTVNISLTTSVPLPAHSNFTLTFPS
jgi:hypothetical protein